MNRYTKFVLAALAAASFTIGCSKTDSPTAPTNNQTGKIEARHQIQPPQAMLDRLAQLRAPIEAKQRELPGLHLDGKGKTPAVDYDNSQYYYEYSQDFGYRYVYNEDVSDWWNDQVQYQMIQVYYWSNNNETPDHTVIIPMSAEDYESFTNMGDTNPYNGAYSYGASISFVENDAATGLTGAKFDFTPYRWDYGNGYTESYGYAYLYRYAIKPEYWAQYGYDPGQWGQTYRPNFFSPFVETYYGYNQNGNVSSIGPYRGPGQWIPADGGQPQTYTISGNVFYDLNGNGVQDGSEPGIQGVNVNFSGGSSTSTDANGFYSFTGVQNGAYSVSADPFNNRARTTASSVNVNVNGANASANFGYAGYSISGVAFLDLNGNGAQDGGEPGIGGQSVSLTPGGATTTAANGSYSFSSLLPGNYSVSVGAISGLTSTTGLSSAVTISSTDGAANFGFRVNVAAYNGWRVSGTQGLGWWKENINKAIRGQRNGVQISAAQLESLRASLANYLLSPLNFANLTAAYNALSYSGGNSASKAAQHMTASEYNVANGSLVNGNPLATWALLAWGENVLQNSGNYSSAYLNAVKDLFEHLNGGQIEVPDPLR